MRGKRVNIYLTAPLLRELQARGFGQEEGVIQEDLSRYYALCEYLSQRVELSSQEWDYLRDALNGFLATADLVPHLPHVLASAVNDARFDGLEDKWGVDADALAEKMLRLHPAEALAVLDAVERWWLSQSE